MAACVFFPGGSKQRLGEAEQWGLGSRETHSTNHEQKKKWGRRRMNIRLGFGVAFDTEKWWAGWAKVEPPFSVALAGAAPLSALVCELRRL